VRDPGPVEDGWREMVTRVRHRPQPRVLGEAEVLGSLDGNSEMYSGWVLLPSLVGRLRWCGNLGNRRWRRIELRHRADGWRRIVCKIGNGMGKCGPLRGADGLVGVDVTWTRPRTASLLLARSRGLGRLERPWPPSHPEQVLQRMRPAGVTSWLGRGVTPVGGEGEHMVGRPGDHGQLLSAPRDPSVVILVSVEDLTRQHGSVLRTQSGVDNIVVVGGKSNSVEAIEMTSREDSVVGGRGRM